MNADTMKINLEVLQKTENKTSICPVHVTSGHILKGLYVLLQGCMHTYGHCCAFQNI